MKQTILVAYNQICVFDPLINDPFNDWADAHVKQGFAWLPGSVSFAGSQNIATEIEVVRRALPSLSLDSTLAISVPYNVEEHGCVVVGSIGDEREVDIDPGMYELVYELRTERECQWCCLNFMPASQPSARIIKADKGITRITDLSMGARPAI